MTTTQRVGLGILVIVLAGGLFGAIAFLVDRAQTAFASRGGHARIQAQARMEASKRERDAYTPTGQFGARDR